MSVDFGTKSPYIIQKEQPPFADTFGPFYDETILSGIDRLLYLCGAQKFGNFNFPLLGLKTILGSDFCSLCEDDFQTCNTSINSKDKSCRKKGPSSGPFFDIKRDIICPICSGKPNDKIGPKLKSLLKKFESYNSFLSSPFKTTLWGSYALCSLACHRVKDFILGNFKPEEFQWLWARKRNEDDYQIYEIFKNKGKNSCHSGNCRKQCPIMILIVTPNGVLVPFETIRCQL